MMMIQPAHDMIDERRWAAVTDRDRRFDGAFVYAVQSTGIYCRPSCPSKRPARRGVHFFADPPAAEAAGFRACLRCEPRRAPVDPSVETVRAVCAYIDANSDEATPTLAEIGAAVGRSPSYVQRLFKRVMGISPRQYADAKRLGRVKALLRDGSDVTGALYEAGYGSSSRLYERSDAQLGMTPATYRRGGQGARIAYVVTDCALGRVMVAATDRGICFVAIADDDIRLTEELAGEFPKASIEPATNGLSAWVEGILAHLDGDQPAADLPLDIRATAFQRRVWQELRAIPMGETLSYSEIARRIGAPGAARAVGRACASNPVSLVVPCHRAVRGDGGLGGYRWGADRKRALLDREHEIASDAAKA